MSSLVSTVQTTAALSPQQIMGGVVAVLCAVVVFSRDNRGTALAGLAAILVAGPTVAGDWIARNETVQAVAQVPQVAALLGATPTTGATCVGGGTDAYLAAIREIESNGDYLIESSGPSSASGAYQFVDGTWANYGGYARANQAPPGVQDAKAAEHWAVVMDMAGGRPEDAAAAWFLGHVPKPAEWDVVPPGNVVTPREYQAKWQAALQDPSGCQFALPLPASTRADLAGSHHDYPAADLTASTGTEVFAIEAGRVVAVTTNRTTCAPSDVSSDECKGEASTCGVGVVIEGVSGARWSYCHGSHLNVATGNHVATGDLIMLSGNTGRSTGPHLHVGVRVAGQNRCPQPLLVALFDGTPAPDPSTLPASGCTH